MEKTVEFNGKSVKLKATAALPRLYRILFSRDIFKDMAPILKRYQNIKIRSDADNEENLDVIDQIGDDDLEILENLTYSMARAADPEMKQRTALEWLDQFSSTESMALQQQAFTLWAMDNFSIDESKKKAVLPNGK
ncbi:MAG: hypothetical protein ACOX6P_11495 [Candidatus Merdivicinus sp.]|jgi:hypothetical protein